MPYKRQSVKALGRAVSYVLQKHKTVDADGYQWATGINCSPQFAFQEFRATRASYRKDSPVWFYHYTQSFSPDEPITVQQAHELAKEFAEKAWPDSQILIATHMDTDHIHSHFVVNSVCYESGYMLRQGPTTLKKIRKLSDEICLAHGFSVLPPDPPKHHKEPGNREYRSMDKNQSWKLQLMIAIEDAMVLARSREHFIKLLERKGYKVRWTDERKNITYTTPGGKKCRDILLYNPKFLKEMMEYEFKLRAEIIGQIEGAVPSAGPVSGRGGAMRYSDGEELGGDDWPSAVTDSAAGGDSDSGDAAGNQGGTGGVSRTAGAGVGASLDGNAVGGAESSAEDGAVSGRDNEESVVTGWEDQRRLFTESLFGAGEDEQIYGQAVLDSFYSLGGAGDIGADIAYLSADVAGIIDEDYRPQDSTTMKNQKKKKRALGQKPDEQDQEHGQRM